MEVGERSPRCAHHPEVDAAGVCARCGDYVCAECRAPGVEPPLCRPCLLRVEPSPVLRQVTFYGVVLMVHGGMLLTAAVMGAFFTVAFAISLARVEGPDAEVLGGPPWVVLGVAGVATLLHALVGAAQAYGGYRLYRLEGRAWALVGSLLGPVTLVGCYCFPTSLGVLIWGLLVLLRADVVRRFRVSPAPP
ncbi:MAG: hypothetical protein ACFCGT_23570 [Sandaracinaceae bacterium]